MKISGRDRDIQGCVWYNWMLPNEYHVTTRLGSLGKRQTNVLDILSQYFSLGMPAQRQEWVRIPS